MDNKPRQVVGAVLVAALVFETGCGAILYPERRGQKGGRIDAGVAVLDGIGLLFFILPGVIAFAVDFGTGTIYLPPGVPGPLQTVHFDPRGGRAGAERAVRERTGVSVRLDSPGMQAFELDSAAELPARFAAARFIASR